MAQIDIHITLPEEVLAFARLGRDEVGEEMRRLLLLELVRDDRISYGKAAELLGVSQAEFLAYMAQHRISPFQFTPEEISEELEPLQ